MSSWSRRSNEAARGGTAWSAQIKIVTCLIRQDSKGGGKAADAGPIENGLIEKLIDARWQSTTRDQIAAVADEM